MLRKPSESEMHEKYLSKIEIAYADKVIDDETYELLVRAIDEGFLEEKKAYSHTEKNRIMDGLDAVSSHGIIKGRAMRNEAVVADGAEEDVETISKDIQKEARGKGR